MNDYIQFPLTINSIDELEEGRVKCFLNNCNNINKNRYSLENLRKLYLKDKNEFITLVDELSLRGFTFHTEKPNNLLPSGDVPLQPYIWATEDKGIYQSIDFQTLGMSGFIRRFRVESDLFFHRIPLHGFKRINRNLELDDLKQELHKAGFEIISGSGGTVKEDAAKWVSIKKGEPFIKETLNEMKTGSSQLSEVLLVSINDTFPEEKFWQFRAFCNRKGIQYISEVTSELMEEHQDRKKVNPNRVMEIKERLAELLNLDKPAKVDQKNMNNKIDKEVDEINPPLSFRGYSINEVFTENIFRTFREFCTRNGIRTLDEITDEYIEKYRFKPGVGDGKVNAVKERMKVFQLSLEAKKTGDVIEINPTDEKLEKIDGLFSEYKFWSFRDFCNKKHIEYVSKLTSQDLEEYGQMKGIGIGKVDAVKQRIAENSNKYKGNHQENVDDLSVANIHSVLIEDIFADNQFRWFRKYCQKMNLRNIFDIKEYHLVEFGTKPGVGIGKINAAKQKLQFALANLPEEKLPIITTAALAEIEIVFSESKFNLFKEFCKKNNIQTLGQLKAYHIEMFKNYKMVGKKKVDEVKNVLNYYTESEDSTVNIFETGEIYESIKDKAVSEILRKYGYEFNSHSELNIKDIQGIDVKELLDVFEPNLLISLSKKLQKQQTPTEIASKIKDILADRDFEIIEYRYGQEKTLEELGNIVGVTRERIRQIAKKAVRKINSHLGRTSFVKIVRILADSDSFIQSRDLIEMVGSEHSYLVNLLKQQENRSLNYYKLLDSFFFENKGKINFKKLENFVSELPDFFNLYEQQQSIEEVLESIGIDNPSLELIQQLLESNHFIKYGEFYSRGKLSISDALTFLFKYKILDSFRLDENSLPRLQELAKQHLDFELGDSVRSIDARIRDSEKLLLVDRLTYRYFDSESFDSSIMQEIEHYLKQELEIRDVINVDDVFQHFENQLAPLGVRNKLHLYSLIRFYLDEQFIIGKGNTLNIFSNEKSKISLEDRIISFMKKHRGLCTKEQLLEVAKPMFKVDGIVSSSNQILPWGNKHVILVENLKLQKSERSQLLVYIQQTLQKGYATVNAMHKEMMFDRKLSELLRNKGIDEPAKLGGIIKLIAPNVKGHSNFIYPEGSTIDSFEKVIISQFTDETPKNEMRAFIYEHGYKEMMAATFIKKLIEQGVFVETDVDMLYPANKLELTNSMLLEIKLYIEEQLGAKQYLSLSNLKGYRRRLPSIDFRWNPYLLKSVLERCGFRQVKKFYADNRYDKVIIVKEDSPIVSFEDLIIHILTTEYDGNMHEFAIYDYLMKNGVVREQEYMYKKVLPHEIKVSENFSFDELGNVKVKWGDRNVVIKT